MVRVLKVIFLIALFFVGIAVGTIIDKNEFWTKNFPNVIQTGILLILSVTAYFVYEYWRQTQDMKSEMVKQTKLSNMPIIDIEIEEPPTDEGYDYDVFIANRGQGPAFKVIVHQIPLSMRAQGGSIVSGKHIPSSMAHQKTFSITGAGCRGKFYRESLGSIEK